MSIFLKFRKMTGYRGYTGYKSKKALVDKDFHIVTRCQCSGLQRVTRGYTYYLYYLCNPCNPRQKQRVTDFDSVKILYLQGLSEFVTRVTPVTREKSKIKKNNCIKEMVEQLISNLFLQSIALMFCFRSYTKTVTTFLNYHHPCAPLCKTRQRLVFTQRGAAFLGDDTTMSTPQIDATVELELIRQQRALMRRKRHQRSRLEKYRAEIIALRQLAKPASFQEIQIWLRKKKHLVIDRKTIWDFVQKIPELQTKQEVDNG